MEVAENSCLVCHEAMEIYAIGKCDHPICYKCSTRMRALCEHFYCPICRTDLPEVFFLTTKEKFMEMPARKFITNRKLKIQFENEKIRQRFEELLEHKCRICKDRYPEKSFKGLQDHMRRVHTMFFCDLCLALKIFSSERKCYNRQDLASHRRIGDKDDTSYKGHPLCQFCDERYLDKDELYKHLRKDHYFCHFCESLGSQDFFQEYNNLRDHFMTDHFLCEEGECIDKQFENAFRSEIDLKAHRANCHSRAQSKFQSRQERTLNIDINLVPRPTNRGRGAVGRNDYAEVNSEGGRRQNAPHRKPHSSKREKDDMDRAIQASLSTMSEEAMKKDKKKDAPQEEPKKDKFVDDIENFPALGDQAAGTVTTMATTSAENASLANKFAMSHNMSVGHAAMGSVEDFPVLKKSASGNDLRNMKQQPVINYQALKTSQPSTTSAKPVVKKTVPQKNKASSKPFSNSLAFQDKVDDFPELPKGVMSNNFNRSASSWQSISTPSVTQSVPATSNVSVIKDKPSEPQVIRKDKVPRSKYDDTDFPSLGGSAATGPSVPSKWFKPAKSNTTTSAKNIVKTFEDPFNGQEPINIIDRYSPVNIPDTPDNDKKTKPNKKKKKKEPAKEQIKKENTKNSLQGNNSLDDIASLLMQSESKKEPVKKVAQQQNVNQNVSVPEVSSRQEKTNKGKEDKIEKKMEDLHLEPEVEDNYQEKADPVKFVIEDDDFPTLGKRKKKTANKPPPGFRPESDSTSAKAPPGFSQQASKMPPPGFEPPTSPPEKKVPPESMPVPGVFDNYDYHQPAGFSERNKELIGVIQACCDNPQDFMEFKRLSGEFRRSDVGAQNYYESCEEVLGKKNFTKVFPELLALLPDISKQQELLSVYIVKNGMQKDDDGVLKISKKSRSSKGAWTPTLSGFLTCQTCHQVLVRKDYNAHVTIHNLDTDFPSLSGEASVVNGSLGSYGSWVKAK